MNTIIRTIFIIASLLGSVYLLASDRQYSIPDEVLKQEALQILKAKCNVCHKKQNPFMVFNERNMERRSQRIYRLVFVEKRMPKGDEQNLSKEEYETLKKWISGLQIN